MFGLRFFSADDFDDEGTDLVTPLTIFFAFGIYLVFRRYQNNRNRPIPFRWVQPKEAEPGWQSIVIESPGLRSHETRPDLLPPLHPEGREYITCYDPATAFHLDTILADDSSEIERKIESARTAQQTWRNTSFAQRRRVIRSLKKWLVENQETCARVACRDTGKTMIDAALGEILTTCSKMDWIITHGERYLKPEPRRTNLMLSYKRSEVHYEPLGVVAAIVSWNYPLHNAWSPILAGLFAGNAVVVKCSEQVIWSTRWFVGAIKECLKACGYSQDLVQLVCCWPNAAEALTKSPHIKHITFIGSEEVGRKVAQAATEHLTPVTLELGGKDPVIILQGTDLTKHASVWMRGVYQNLGQNCIGIEKILVHSTQYDELYELLVDRVKDLRCGAVLPQVADDYLHPVDCGAMISTERFDHLEMIIEEAKSAGATVEVGGKRHSHPYHAHGAFFTPTIVGDAPQMTRIAQEELFAPIALLMPYDTTEEAIEIANGTRYGLGASVFGPNQEECINVAKHLECGMVSVNDFGVFYLNQDLPFGGTKASGYGRFGGPEGLRSLTNPKAIVVDRWPWLVQTSIPKVLDYPIGSLQQSWAFVSGLVGLLYAEGWRARFDSLTKLINAAGR
ncbi:ALDH-like protein [Gloeophyllum trabeum ATCC 11539]|uniref:ALDH-like protein n=1 Tax=Gloeophyllum trabeum (strain ATCC 11539 / FP-39264 / Madison 617) TaxID=670483 RepID=S7QKU1_GLOTA|nr:ALDH-like protein [Gloeophyllum trabeum ATCC 11539]EPQ60441.1 ALDH-like protein [Gloeophyllum trabeum ATCC 11539]